MKSALYGLITLLIFGCNVNKAGVNGLSQDVKLSSSSSALSVSALSSSSNAIFSQNASSSFSSTASSASSVVLSVAASSQWSQESVTSSFALSLYSSFGVGFGGANAFKFQDDTNHPIWMSAVDLMLNGSIATDAEYKRIKNFHTSNFTSLQQYLQKSTFFTIWITKGWEESWFDIDKINFAISKGKVPVFIYWYFGDTLLTGTPIAQDIVEYQLDNKRLKTFLDKIEGYKLLIMEPEFNKQTVLDDATSFITMISDAISILDDNSTLFSLCMSDTGKRGVRQTYSECGYANCALGDKYEWSRTETIYDALLPQLDFISFQQMLGQFSRDDANPGSWESPNAKRYSSDEIGVYYLPKRVQNFSTYLYERYKKPVYMPYIAIATATWEDKNSNNIIDSLEIDKNGFEEEAAWVYQNLDASALQSAHLFGFSVMELFDEPFHDKGGYQYFLDNEYHLGIIKSSAQDGIDEAINGDIVFKSTIIESIFK